MRTQFKKVVVGGECFLYPLPVIKEQKYLIRVEERFADFWIYCLEKKIIPSPDEHSLKKVGLHSDGRTPVLEFDLDDLHFHYLQDDPKAQKVESVLSKKIVSVLKGEGGSLLALDTRYQAQLNCQTCQGLGIDSDRVKDMVNLLSS